jgi:hypothetical protein
LQAEDLAFALEDLARGCAYRVMLEFGPSVKIALQEVKQKPPYGSVTEVVALLQGLL